MVRVGCVDKKIMKITLGWWLPDVMMMVTMGFK